MISTFCNIWPSKSGGLSQMKKTNFEDVVEDTQGLIDKSLLLNWEDD